MDYDQLELQRETIFKNAVIEGAEKRAKTIVERAEMNSQRELQTALLTCEEADHDTVAARCALKTAKQVGALSHTARREMLEWRAAKVNELFTEIEEELAAFTQSGEYEAWLLARLAEYKAFLAGAKAPVVYLREEDMPLAEGLQAAAEGASFEAAGDIRLGGCKLSDGKRLHDETLDAALEKEKQRFYAESGLCI